MTRIGIIGGTGLYELPGLSRIREIKVDTPFGEPSDSLVTGELSGAELVFVPRHGRGHRLLPNEVPYRANIYALKSLGVEWVLSVSAVGSLREEIHPGELVIPAQYVDQTRRRVGTFFGNGLVAHVSLAVPVCPVLSEHLAAVVAKAAGRVHREVTYVCIEGPAFSTRAESELFRAAKMDVIGMTAMPEVRLAREAELHYATLGLVTDYDCWHESEAAVSADAVVEILKKGTEVIRSIIVTALPGLVSLTRDRKRSCACDRALATALLTQPADAPAKVREALLPIIGKYVK